MASFGASTLVAAYIAVALQLLIFNLNARWSWRVKAFAIVTMSALYAVAYFSYPTLLGWPAALPLPQRFKLIAAQIEPADGANERAGDIMLWAIDLADDPGTAEPRAYRVPYSAELQQKVNEAGERIRKGLPQIGEVRKGEPSAQGTATAATTGTQKQGGDAARAGDSQASNPASVNVEFVDAPEPKFPDK